MPAVFMYLLLDERRANGVNNQKRNFTRDDGGWQTLTLRT